ncbi:MAG: VIT1/CCC1 transporter family protein [Candidatus Rokuibacteriota bacterium]
MGLGGNARLARTLVLDELFDLALYRELRPIAGEPLRSVLDQLIPIETRHAAFWQDFFGTDIRRLDLWRALKLRLLTLSCRLFGDPAIHLVLEAIEIYGVRKYLTLWETYRQEPLGKAVRTILEDELRHEDQVVSASIDRRVDPESIRSLFLGFNDGLVEILGAVAGFFAAFADAASILVASSTVAVAGAFSMSAGTYVANSSEREMTRLEEERRAFLGEGAEGARPAARPLRSAVLVGVSYLLGAIVPVLPVALGARSIVVPILTGALVTVAVSAILAFLSGLRLGRRLAINVAILGAAVAVTYLIGLAAKAIWGISVD